MIMKKIISAYKKISQPIFLMTVILAGAFAPIQNSHAQNNTRVPLPCGGYGIDLTSLKERKSIANNISLNRTQTLTPYQVRVYFHILRESNGLNACATEQQVMSEFNELTADYASGNICFLNMGIDYINDSQLDTNYNPYLDPGGVSILHYKTPICINVFYLKQIKGTNTASGGGIGGFTFFSPWDACVVSAGNLGYGHTTSHEVGHCLGLLHTYEHLPFYENINGTNSTTAGDLISDTPADPYSHKQDQAPSCFSTAGCLYNGSCTDPNGQTNYTPPYTNLMAYWWQYNCYPNLTLTPQQYGFINALLANNYDFLIPCESPQTATQNPIDVTSGYYMFSAVNTVNTNGNVNISLTAVATFGGGTVLLEPGFHASPSDGGKVLITSTSCNFTAGYAANSKVTDKEVINKIKPVTLTCIPNPARNYVSVRYQLPGAGRTSITLFDMTGRSVKIIQTSALRSAGQHEAKVDLGTMNSGIYVVTMIYNGQTTVANLIVTK
jgi:hypothetical protein